MVSKKLIGGYQWIRLIATVFVVIGHSCSLAITKKDSILDVFDSVATETQIVLELLRQMIYSFHMPLFVFLSGSVFALSYERILDIRKWFSKRSKRLICTYLFVALCFFIPIRILIGYYEEYFDIFQIFFHDVILSYDINYLWYLLMLTEVTGVVVIFRRWFMSNKKTTRLFVLLVCFFISTIRYVLPSLPFQINRAMEFLLWFYIGMLSERELRQIKFSNKWVIIIFLSWLWGISFFLDFFLEYVGNFSSVTVLMLLFIKVVKMMIRLIKEGSAVFCIFLMVKDFSVVRRKIFKIIESESMNIYLYHVGVILLLRYIIQNFISPNYMSNTLYLFFCVIIAIIGICVSIFIGCIINKCKRFFKSLTL